MKKKFVCALVSLALLFALAVPVFAAGESCVVLGADLTEEQIKTVYQLFGVTRGSVAELKVTNAEERKALEGVVEESVIGKYAISCVYVQLLEEGAGLTVDTYNISWCTVEMYKNALITAGVTDAKIIVAAPFEVSGTAALTGIYKAYEQSTGSKLDENAKAAGTQELSITGKLAEQIGEFDATRLISGLKETLGETANMSDEELRQKIAEQAGRYNLTLSDKQLQQLVDLIRTMQNLDPSAMKERIEDAKETIQRIEEAKDKASGFFDKLRQFCGSAADFLDRVKSWFN